ncbi:MAG: hypothetical protein V4719_08770 [Planctomycetota bacterium]
MNNTLLTSYWIKSVVPHAPLGFGVTAFSFDDALRIIYALDYGRYLPGDPKNLHVIENVRIADLDEPHVVANMGPTIVRGLWYPFRTVGIPAWAAERLTVDRA